MIGKKSSKNVTRKLAIVLVIAMLVSLATPAPQMNMAYAAEEAATIITAGEGSLAGSLSTAESYTVTVEDCCLQATVGTNTFKFRNYLNIVGICTVSADDLLHILTLAGKYYVVDLRYSSFITIDVWRNPDTWEYAAKGKDSSYEVFGSTIINTKFFIEVYSGRERLMTRAEFEAITNPKPENPATEAPTTEGTKTEAPTTEGTKTEAPTTEGTKTEAPTTEEPKTEAPTTEEPKTEAPTTEEPKTEAPTTEEPKTEAPTTEAPRTETPTTEEPATEAPTKVIETKGTIDIDWWYQKYIDGEISWEALMQVLYQYNWKATREEDSREVTYYFYDENGNLIRTEKVGKVIENSSGSGEGTISAETKGETEIKVTEEEKGTVEVEVDITTTVTEVPTTQVPTTEQPTTEDPTTQSPTTEKLTTEAPKTEAPKAETPVVDTGVWPEVEWPTLDVPTTEAPKTEAPKTEQQTTEVPTQVTEIKGTVDIDWWYAKYTAGDITWEELMQVLYQYQWKAAKQEDAKEITYFFYDADGKLVRQEKVGKVVEQASGVGTGTVSADTKGAAEVKVAEKEAGTSTVKVELQTVTTGDTAAAKAAAEAAKAAAEAAKATQAVAAANSQTAAQTNNVVKKATKKKTGTYYHVKRKGKKVTLERRKGKKTGAVCSVIFDKKKKTATYDGYKKINIRYVGYTQGSRQILVLDNNENAWIGPRGKGEIGQVYTWRKLKGKWKLAIEDNAGLVIRLSNKKGKVKGVKNATPKLIKK